MHDQPKIWKKVQKTCFLGESLLLLVIHLTLEAVTKKIFKSFTYFLFCFCLTLQLKVYISAADKNLERGVFIKVNMSSLYDYFEKEGF